MEPDINNSFMHYSVEKHTICIVQQTCTTNSTHNVFITLHNTLGHDMTILTTS